MDEVLMELLNNDVSSAVALLAYVLRTAGVLEHIYCELNIICCFLKIHISECEYYVVSVFTTSTTCEVI